MSDITIARRYARALYEEADKAGRVDRVDEDAPMVLETLAGSPELQRMLSSALITREKKQAVLEGLFAESVDDLLVRLMRLLAEKGREDILPAVIRAYSDLRLDQRGEIEAHVKVAFALAPEELDRLKQRLEALTGRNVRLRVEEVPDLISGLVVRVGDTVYDGSARHQLKTLREQFAARTFATN
jgi:F-type H+-transporting ATPase subunit delta